MRNEIRDDLDRKQMEVGVFNDVDGADRAIGALLDAGFLVEQITVVSSDRKKAEHFAAFKKQDPAGAHTAEAAVVGSGVGAAVGGVAVGVAALATGGAALWIAGAIAAAGG